MGNNLSKFGSTFITSTRVNSCWVRAANGKLKCVSFSVRCGSEGELKEHLKENRVLIQEALIAYIYLSIKGSSYFTCVHSESRSEGWQFTSL
jgi:hypothetical protein